MKNYISVNLLFICLLFVYPFAAGAAMNGEIVELQDEWARIKYQLPENEQEKAFSQLAEKADRIRESYPGNAEALVWEGIILSTYAGVKGGLGALGLVKEARNLFEQAIETEPAVMNGSAFTSLGSLYYQVPSWPIGFGDKDKALEYLTRGLELNPDGIDSNYFYGDFLLEKGELPKAEKAFNKAMQAPDRPGRKIADEGRRQEIQQALDKIRKRQSLAERKNSAY